MLTESEMQQQLEDARAQGQEEKDKVWPKIQKELKSTEQNVRPTVKEFGDDLKKLEQTLRPEVKKVEASVKKFLKKRF
jgi:hypothetical protein